MKRIVLALSIAIASAAGAQQPTARPSTGEAWQIIQPPQSSLVLARDGSLIGEIGKQWRTSIPLRAMPRYLPQAFIAVEDQRFYQHDGVDLIGVAGAIKGKLLGERRGGASTITQQLVGNMHPDLIDRSEKTISRKLHEQAAAREMEKHYTKEEILDAYLNFTDLGHNWFGVEAASRHYFGKPASKLTLWEAASLASLPKSPTEYDPIRHPDRNRQRRNVVLALMAQQHYITPDEAANAEAQPVVTAPNDGMSAAAPYFVDAVRVQAERAGVPVTNGGYALFTTIDPALQRAANVALVDGLARVEQRKGYDHQTYAQALAAHSSDYLQGAVVAMDPFTGDVRALVGGRNYAMGPFDRAIDAHRQPGSSIKPFVYSLALLDSVPPNAIVPDTALAITLPNGTIYRPDDAEAFAGPMTIRTALIQSRNSVAIQLALRVGLDSVAAFARRMGIASPVAPVPASAIGASVVRPIELVAAYSNFVNLGEHVAPRLVTRIDDATGRTVFAQQPSVPEPDLDPRVAFIVRNMMVDVTTQPGGTGLAARRAVPNDIPVAGKTGTTNDNVDVWFLGVTPDIVAGVWLGFDKPKTIAPGVAGGTLAAPIWGDMLARWYATRQAPHAWAAAPGGISFAELDRATGELANDSTPPERRYVEYFIPGTEPPALRGNPWALAQWGLFIH